VRGAKDIESIMPVWCIRDSFNLEILDRLKVIIMIFNLSIWWIWIIYL